MITYDNDELRTLTNNQLAWGASWRQRDFAMVTDQRFRQLLSTYNITTIGWRDLVAFRRPPVGNDEA